MMLARSVAQSRSNRLACPSCHARKLPTETQITQMKARISTMLAMVSNREAGVAPDPAWNAADCDGVITHCR